MACGQCLVLVLEAICVHPGKALALSSWSLPTKCALVRGVGHYTFSFGVYFRFVHVGWMAITSIYPSGFHHTIRFCGGESSEDE